MEEKDVKMMRDNWTLALMRRGIIVNLSINRWRGTTKLTPELLGIKFSDQEAVGVVKQYLKFGHQKLLPPDVTREFDGLEIKAREVLSAYSFKTVWGRFVPVTAFDAWESENEVIKDAYLEVAKNFGNDYTDIVGRVKDEYAILAKDVWARLHPDLSTTPTGSFVENFSNNIVSKIPPLSQIMSSFKYDTVYSFIPMPSFMETDIAKAKDIQRDSNIKDFKNEVQRQTEIRVAEIYIQKKTELIDGFLETTVSAMRKNVSELCNEVLISMGKSRYKGRVSDVHVKKLRKMIDKVRILNFYDDEEVSSLLNGLEFEVDKFKHDMDKDVIVEKLEKIVSVGTQEFLPEDFSPAIGYLEV